MSHFKEITCCNCGWVHVELPLTFVIGSVNETNAFLEFLPKDVQLTEYGGRRASVVDYTKCVHCGGSYTNFRDYEEGDCPIGVTIGPILARDVVLP